MIPTCPNCKAKFARDAAKMRCGKCGLPDEVRDAGADAISGWVEMTMINKRLFGRRLARKGREEARADETVTKSQAKRWLKSGRQRRRNKHGRIGVHAR